jgi:polyisoprenoid-binding protein YceI
MQLRDRELEKSALVVAQPKASTSPWAIDRVHSTAQFKVKHMMISNVLGEFTSISGVLERDENDVTKSRIRASINADTINTGEPQRDAHLKSADFFHVEKHPALTFNSTAISKNADGELKVSGDLTIRRVTRTSSLILKDRAQRKRGRGEIRELGFLPRRGSAGKTLASPGTQLWKPAACSWAMQ